MFVPFAITGRGLGSDQCIIHHSMNDTSIDVYCPFSLYLETIVLLLAAILLVVILTVESDFSLLHATDCTGKLACELSI